MERDQPGVVLARHGIVRLVHPQGRKDAFPHERIHALPRDRLHQGAQHPRALTVSPPCARIVQQREIKLGGRRAPGSE